MRMSSTALLRVGGESDRCDIKRKDGAAPYKNEWCDVEQLLFDSFISFRALGHLVTSPYAVLTRTWGAIKSSPRLWPIALFAKWCSRVDSKGQA
jgi:CelD/BcsL family acetyltransferase involved in cellulose biosynthesis